MRKAIRNNRVGCGWLRSQTAGYTIDSNANEVAETAETTETDRTTWNYRTFRRALGLAGEKSTPTRGR